MEKWEAEKQEVLTQSHCYIAQCAREIKADLRPMDEAVQGFKVFGDNASIYTAFILATLEWGCIYHHYNGRDPVPTFPEWLTTYIGVTDGRFAAILDRPLRSKTLWRYFSLSQCFSGAVNGRH